MGYDTYFNGTFELDKKLDDETYNLLVKLNETRRMKRNMKKLFPEMTDDEILKKWGVDGEFYFDGVGFLGQDSDASVVNCNRPPSTQPGLWCQWRPTEDRMGIEWDGGEKAYGMDDWIVYIVDKILKPRGYVLNGEAEANGDDVDDRWKIAIKDNNVRRIDGRWVWDE